MTHPDLVTAPPTGGRRERPRRWLVIAVAVWIAVLGGGILWAVQRGEPTARDQTTVADARPVVDRAVAEIAAAASVDGYGVPAISGFERLEDCRVSVLRQGERYRRTVTVVVTPGTEDALLGRVADRLPASYGASVHRRTLSGDAGFWVALSGEVVANGQVRFAADTGACRPRGDLPASDATPGNRAEVVAALDRLGLPATAWHTNQVACPGGGTLTTVEAISAPDAEPGAFDELLAGLGSPVIATPDLYAYTTAASAVVVRHDPTEPNVVVTATRAC